MKKINQLEKNNKMSTTTDVSKKQLVSAISDWVIDTLSDLPIDQIEVIRESLKSKKDDLHKILSTNIKDKSSKKIEKDPNAPKRGKSGYIFFCIENREKIKKSNPDMSAKDIIKELGAVWRSISPDKKEKYNKMSENDKQRYSGEISEYVPPENFIKKNKNVGPKRSLTSYIFFCKEQRAFLKEKQPSLSTKDITSELGKLWQALSDKEKTPYIKLADEDKHRYEHEKTLVVNKEDNKEKTSKKKSEKNIKEKASKKKSEKNINEKTSKKKSEKTSKKPFGKSGYTLFCKEERSLLKEKHSKWSSQQLTNELLNLWNGLSKDDQSDYNYRANDEDIDDEL